MQQFSATVERGFRIQILFLAVVFSLFISPAPAERLPIKTYTSADGFSTSAAFGLVRDGRGFIWLCSRDGLVRFDGYRFNTYLIGDEKADQTVLDLVPTRSGVY